MPYIVWVILFVAIVGGLPELIKLIKKNRTSDNVKYCIKSSILDLRRGLFSLQNDIILEDEYKLHDDDFSNLDILLNGFTKHLENDYFWDKLPQYVKNPRDSYYLYLRDFLIENQSKMKLLDIDMYEAEENYNSSVIPKFHLTDFAITYYKALCILQTYYIKFKKFDNENNAIIHDLKALKKAIDKRWTY